MTSSTQSRLGTAPEEGCKAPVKTVANLPITLAGEQTINSVALVAGDRVLVNGQTDKTENGIYDVSTTNWTYAKDWNKTNDVIAGMLVPSSETVEIYQLKAYTGAFTAGTTEVEFQTGAVVSRKFEHQTGADASGTTFTLQTMAYTPNVNDLEVEHNGQTLITGQDYTELTSTTVQILQSFSSTSDFVFKSNQTVSLTTTTTASSTHTDSGIEHNLASYLNRRPLNLKDYGALGDGVTDDVVAIQTAVTAAITTGRPLYCPEGIYIMNTSTGDNFHSGTDSAVRLDLVAAANQGLTMYGAGMGRTIFKQGDGENADGGKYTRMFICLLSSTEATTYDLGHFHFSGFTLDKNARGNSAPPTDYAWEASHMIAFQGTEGASKIESIVFEDIELYDKIGVGLAVGPTTVNVELLVARNIHSPAENHPTATGPTIGQKGCIEFAIDSELTTLDAVNCIYSQIEPTSTAAPDEFSYIKISNSKMDTFEYTDSTGFADGISYRYVDMVNTHCLDGFIARGINLTATNCRLKDTLENFYIDTKFSNCVWLLDYDSDTDVVDSWYANCPTAMITAGVSTSVTMSNCSFLIDALTVDAACTGYALRGSVTTTNYGPRVTLNNCKFDPRLYGTVQPYSTGGHWKFSGCEMAGHTTAVYGGAFSSYVNSVELDHCDFSKVTGDYLHVQNSTPTYTIKINGTYLASDWSQTYGSSIANQDYYYSKPRLLGTAAPTSGVWFVGDRVYNTTPVAGGAEGWVCTTAGTSGTWKTFGTIAA